MYSRIISASLQGIDAYLVGVEVDLSDGLPGFEVVGLPDSSIREAKDRVRTAIKNAAIRFPIKKITVNLAPAHQRKEGSGFDLPIAVGILCACGILQNDSLNHTLLIGELSLDGSIHPVHGILPMVHRASINGITRCIVPEQNKKEASIVENIEIIGVSHIKEVMAFLKGELPISPEKHQNHLEISSKHSTYPDFSDVKGQENVKRGLEIAAAGSHNLIMIGPPGSGKTMMAKRLPSILPPLTYEESIELTKIYSIVGKLSPDEYLIQERPFRSPHHTVSPSALTGGGKIPKPGEVSLAHRGVLFLDELPEFSKQALEILRQPLEDCQVTISRVNATLTYPSDFMLVASLNPCPCGYFPDVNRCTCTPMQIKKYLNKISGPLLDRIDLHVETQKVEYKDLQSLTAEESSKSIRARVLTAQKIQKERYHTTSTLFNSQLTPSQIGKYCVLNQDCKDLLRQAFHKLSLSARSYHRILKVARTIADLHECNHIEVSHIAEAIQYRSLDRKYWS